MPKSDEKPPTALGLRLAAILTLILFIHALLPRFSMFHFGVLIGLSDDNTLRRLADGLSTTLVLAVYAAVTAAYVALPLDFTWFVPFYGLASSLLFIKTCFGRGVLNRIFSQTVLRWLGNLSYSFYLIHPLAVGVVCVYAANYFRGMSPVISVLLYCGSAFAVAVAFSVVLFAVSERWYFCGGRIVGARRRPHPQGNLRTLHKIPRCGKERDPLRGRVIFLQIDLDIDGHPEDNICHVGQANPPATAPSA
jgi:peptidoglycan/LPS O-acetylase OafA/YrhL